MRRCIVCEQEKSEKYFGSAITLTCNVCHRGMTGDNVHGAAGRTHSIGIKPHPHGNRIASDLLNVAGYKAHVGPMAPPINCRSETVNLTDDRPLIDKLHEATFGDAVGMVWIRDKYAFRMLIRKAHCFTLDSETSAMVADLSLAIAKDLEVARRLAIPPFPVTWVEVDNQARIERLHSLSTNMTPRGDTVPKVGWLIHPGDNGGFFATYATWVEQGILLAPLSYWWHCGEASLRDNEELKNDHMMWMAFGMKETNVNPYDAFPSTTPMHEKLNENPEYVRRMRELMAETAGKLRHVWGFLIALGAGHLGVEMRTGEAQRHNGPVRTMKNGKPLLPLEHKVLHLHLGKRLTVDKVVMRAITHHRKREHDVRGHFETYRNEAGEVRMRVAVKSHVRGDRRLGRIEKTYSVEK